MKVTVISITGGDFGTVLKNVSPPSGTEDQIVRMTGLLSAVELRRLTVIRT